MTEYIAPLREMRFALNQLAGLPAVIGLPGFEDSTPELIDAVLEGAGKLAGDVLSPLNRAGDRNGAALGPGGVTPAPGFAEAYRRFVENGWGAIAADPEFGGQGLPQLVAAAASEMWAAANMAFALCPMLTAGAMEAIRAHASPALKAVYLPKLISGEWTGTMNLTESQAGSDLSAVRARAVPEGGRYRIFGTKIFITWGDHDMTENVVHLVLARLPDAPEGTRGISLFLVPKFLARDDGGIGARNDVVCAALEHKLGIHASPTCVMSFGERDGAVGYLVGEANCGLANMFTMMNEARQKVGLQGLAIAERAYQAARDFAKERVQGRPAGQKSGGRMAIIHHPDVRRMLLTMKSQIEAMRGFAYVLAADVDFSHRHPDEAERARRRARVDLLTPVLKGFCTEIGQEIASLGVQVFGGMGFIEETGAAQYFRDARIATIYEGTTGIQAADLAGRKLPMRQGEAMRALIAELRDCASQLEHAEDLALRGIFRNFSAAISALEQAAGWMLQSGPNDPAALAGSFNFLMLTGYVCGGWQLARAALIAAQARRRDSDAFYPAKFTTAAFYAEQILPKAPALLAMIRAGASGAQQLPAEQF